MRAVVLLLLCAAVTGGLRALPARAQLGPAALDGVLFAGAVESEGFPTVVTPLYVVTRDGLPVVGLRANQLIVRESDVPLPAGALTLEADNSEPMTLVLLLDRSTTPGEWANVTAAAVALLGQLRPGDRAGLLSYSDGVELISPLTGDLNRLRASVIGTQPGGAFNAVNSAIDDAYDLFADAEPGRRAIFVVGDGPDNLEAAGIGPQPSPTVLAETGRQLGISVHSYGYGPLAFAPDLQTLAAFTGGRSLTVSTAGDLAGLLQTAPALLRQGYVLSYRSSLPADDSERLLSIVLGSAPAVTRPFIARRTAIEVQITNPLEGATVTGGVVIGFSASAPAPIRSVTFRLDNGEVITTTTAAVGGIIWDSAAVEPGAYRVSVQVEDSAGNIGQDDVSLNVIAPISLRVSVSPDEAQVGDNAVVTAFVQSAFPGTQVELFVGRSQEGVQVNPDGAARFVIDTSAYEPGRYGIVVRATNSRGYSVSDDSQMISLLAAPPVQVTRAVATTPTGVWVENNWPELLALLLALLLLALLIGLGRRPKARPAAAPQRITLVPQVRMLLTNQGNVRTRYRLRAQDAEGALKFTFLMNGLALQPPMVMRTTTTIVTESRPPAAGNGNGAQTVVTPAPATSAVSAAAGRASTVAEGATQAAGVAGTLLTGLGQLLPGAAGDKAKAAARGLRMQTGAVKKVQFEASEVLDDVSDVKGASRNLAGQAGVKTGSAPAAQPQPSPAAQPARVDSAFALQTDKGAPVPVAAPNPWVETTPVGPGETIGIDLHVASTQRMGRNRQVSFRLMSSPADVDNAPVTMEEVSINLGPRR